MKVFLSLIPLALVVACASPAPQPQIVVQTKLLAPSISPELFDCGDAPRAPAQAIMQSAVARYIVVLWAWGSECQSHLLAVKQSLSVANPTWLNTSKER